MSEVCFKDSGIEWIGKIPEHWEIGKVKHYYQIATGFTPSSDNETFYDDENGHIWITISDLKEKFITDSFSKISQFYLDQYRPKTIPRNSLLYSFKLSVGAVAFNKVDVFTNEAIASFFDNDKISLPFLYYSSKFIIFNANENIYGAKILNQNLIKNAKIVFPPLQEQEAIAHYLDEKTQAIDDLIATHQESIEKLKDYRISLISEVVTQGLDKNVKLKDSGIEWMEKIPATWETMKIRFLFSLHSGLNITKEDLRDEGIPCISYGEIHSKFPCRVDPQIHSLPCVDEGFINTRPKSLLNRGDFVFADTSEDIEGSGNFSSIQTNSMAFAGYHTIVLKPINKDIYAPYFSFLFDSLQIRTQIRSRVCGVKVYSITKSLLRDVFCILPPLQEQEAIAHYLDEKTQAIDELISTHQKSIEKLKDYRISLISEMVTGKKNLQGIDNGN